MKGGITKDTLKDNIGLKIMAVFIAALLWWIVVNVDDPVKTQRYTTEVKLLHTEVVTNVGDSYQIENNLKTITVTVKARRKVIAEIRTNNIVATADFREMQNNLIPIRIEIPGFEGEYVEASANPRNLQIKTEQTLKKTFPITPTTVGEVQTGYVLGTLTAQPQTIDISGPKSLIGRINKVVAKVNISELSQDSELQAEVIYYDSAENVIDKTMLSSNCDKNGVTVNVQILETKKVVLKFDTSEIMTEAGYLFAGLIVEPQTIVVSGAAEKLADLQYIEIPASALRQKNLSKNMEVIIDMNEYLPEGIVLADSSANSVVVGITVEKAGTKSLMLPVRSIKIENSSEKMELSYGPEQEVELKFSGADEILKDLTVENVVACIDLQEYTEEGTYDVAVQIISLPEGCKYIGEATVQITLKKI